MADKDKDAPKNPPRITLPIKDGRIDWEGVKEDRRDKLREVLGLTAAPGPASPPPPNPKKEGGISADRLYQMASLMAMMTVATVTGCTKEQAAVVMLTEDEIAALNEDGLTDAVLAQYLGESVTAWKHGNAVMLGFALFGIVASKVTAFREVRAVPVGEGRTPAAEKARQG